MATPKPYSVSQIKDKLLRPALTSHFMVEIAKPGGLSTKYLSYNGIRGFSDEKLALLCCEASLPGSSLNTHENNNDFTGVTERFAYRRVYDDRIELTFYVDAEQYLPIRFFESWIKWISGEDISEGVKSTSYSYRFKYPDGKDKNGNSTGYRTSLSVLKFERDGKEKLQYDFVGAYPISIVSMPVSYDASSLLKCTVYFTYLRYVMDPTTTIKNYSSEANKIQNPAVQAAYNSDLLSTGGITADNGVSNLWGSSTGANFDIKSQLVQVQ